MNTPNLQSERLLYKPLSTKHCSEDYVSWLNDFEVYKFLDTGGNYNLDKLSDFLKLVEQNINILFWAIHLKENNKHIGNIKIDPVNTRHGFGEYGIMMGDRSEWRKGYAKEASLTIVKYCFEEIKLRKIILGVVEENIAALKLYKNIGFVKEGLYVNHFLYNGKYHNSVRMALFNPQFNY